MLLVLSWVEIKFLKKLKITLIEHFLTAMCDHQSYFDAECR